MSKKALLMILDGWGLGDQKKDDVILTLPLLTGIILWTINLIPNFRQVVRT